MSNTAITDNIFTLSDSEKINAAANKIKKMNVGDTIYKDIVKLPDDTAPVNHFFAYGVYGREMTIPKGVTVIGKIHKYQTLNILLEGELLVSANNKTETIKAPCVIVGEPGTQRMGKALSDVRWICIHPTHEKDLGKIEDKFIAKSLDDPELLDEIKRLEGLE